MANDITANGFSPVDYVVFSLTLFLSVGIGVYHCLFNNKTTEDFLLASRSMSPVPVALSLVATYISAVIIMGVTGEVYGHGIQLIWSVFGQFLGTVISINVFLPIIYNLKLTSINEYLELRFRSCALKQSVLLLINVKMMLFLGFCLYAPSLALESVTPIKSSTIILTVGLAVTFYSSFGGLKAVVWTDAFQSIVIVLGVIITTVTSIVAVGGLGEVWRIATEHGRTDALEFDIGLYTRHTAFNTTLMYTCIFVLISSFHQATLQRVSTMPDYGRVKLIFYLNIVAVVALMLVFYLTGLSVFAAYADCDPISMGYIKRKDQILPYYVMDKLGYMTGVPGAFVACIFSSTLSTISSILNSMATMLWRDLLSHIPQLFRASEKVKTFIISGVTSVLGLIMIGLAFMASHMGGLIQATAFVSAVLGGPILGIFLLGVCVPICGKRGAFAGLVTSIVFITCLAIGKHLHSIKPTMLPLSINGCENITTFAPIEHINSTLTIQLAEVQRSSHFLIGFYNISYTFIMPLGTLVCMTTGILVSLTAGLENLKDIDPAYVLVCLQQYVGGQSPSNEREELERVKPLVTVVSAREPLQSSLSNSIQITKASNKQQSDELNTVENHL